MTAIVVNGAVGRMGRALALVAREYSDLRLLGGTDREALPVAEAHALGYPTIEALASSGSLLSAADVVLDFSSPTGLSALLTDHARTLTAKALVVGTTGLGGEAYALLRAAAGDMAVLQAANFSIGINVLLRLVKEAAHALPADRYDVEIVETHHRRKVDAPSGTALELGRAVASGRSVPLESVRRDGRSGAIGPRPEGEIAFHALRGGDVVGEHGVRFLGGRERIELQHAASDRALFADGALLAARWLAGKAPGRYTMAQVLD